MAKVIENSRRAGSPNIAAGLLLVTGQEGEKMPAHPFFRASCIPPRWIRESLFVENEPALEGAPIATDLIGSEVDLDIGIPQ